MITSYKEMPFWGWALCMVLFLTSCDQYRIKDGKVYHVRTNEGSGIHYDLMAEADAETFIQLEDHFGKDKLHAWYDGQLLAGANGATFRTLGHGYATDDSLVYRSHNLIEGADAATFKVHSYYFAEDSSDFYWEGEALHVADKASFVLMGDADDYNTHWAKDTVYVYYLTVNHDFDGTRMKIADYESFHPMECDLGWYAADHYQVYFQDTIVSGADPATFRVPDLTPGLSIIDRIISPLEGLLEWCLH